MNSSNYMKWSQIFRMYLILIHKCIENNWNNLQLYSDKNVDDTIKNNLLALNVGFEKVLINIYNSERFSTELMCNFRSNHIQVCLHIIKLLLKSQTTTNYWYLNPTDTSKNIFHHLLFVCIPKGKYSNELTICNNFLGKCFIFFSYRNDSNVLVWKNVWWNRESHYSVVNNNHARSGGS